MNGNGDESPVLLFRMYLWHTNLQFAENKLVSRKCKCDHRGPMVTHAPDKYWKIVVMSVDVVKTVVKLIDSIIFILSICKSIHTVSPHANATCLEISSSARKAINFDNRKIHQ